MSSQKHLTTRNPWFMVIPLILLLWVSWHMYITESEGLRAPAHNLLLGGNFDRIDSTGSPAYWSIETSGGAQFTTSLHKGNQGQRSVVLTTRMRSNGDLYLTSQAIPITSNATYFYKGYYRATADFELVVMYHYADGHTVTNIAKRYPQADDPWSTVSAAFSAPQKVQTIQFAYHVTSSGTLHLGKSYVQKDKPELTIAPQPAITDTNLITDGAFDDTFTPPNTWVPYDIGDIGTIFSLPDQDGNNIARATITSYKSGEAKWAHQAVPITPYKEYIARVDYKSTAPTTVVAEFTNQDGTRSFYTLADLATTSRWTTYRGSFDAPSSAVSVAISVVLHQIGTVDTDNYSLVKTAAPVAHFKRPLVSITFDDGWSSDFTNGAEILDTFGYKGTFYINPATIDTKHFMSTSQLQSLIRRGHQLASHSYEHKDLTTLNGKTVDFQLQMARDFIVNETHATAVDLASPYGKTDAEIDAHIPALYASQRGTEDGINTYQNFDPYHLRVLFVGADLPDEAIQSAIQQAKITNGWLILVYHRVNDTPTVTNVLPPKVLARQMHIIERNGMAVKTVRAALQELGPQRTRK